MKVFMFNKAKYLLVRSIVFFVVTLVVTMGNANASCDANSCTNQIYKIYTDDATTYVQLSTSGNEQAGNCALLGGVFATVPTSNPNYKALLSNIMIAYTMNLTITLRYFDGPGCKVAYLYLDKSH
ncbi:MAG TPA: hypothetical protein VIF82_16750 [Burkholderiaceae bacterium]